MKFMVKKILNGSLLYKCKIVDLLIILLSLSPFVVNAQILHHQMLSTFGNSIQLSDGMRVSQTLGQNVIGNSESEVAAQQGFQQSMYSVEPPKTVQPKANNATVKVSPNPFLDMVNFKFTGAIGSVAKISIFDISGKIILSQQAAVVDKQCSIDLSMLTNSEYLVRISSGPSEYYIKILKKIL